MPFFAMDYRVLFHDTMAYGSHHYVTNFRFQNIARETILFESRTEGEEVWRDQLANVILLTREAYTLNLAPVELGQKVAILLSYEDPSRSTVRLCFRVLREDGQPVSCGYQTMVCIDRETHNVVPAPPLITQYHSADNEFSILEQLSSPSFADRLKTGTSSLKAIFSDGVVALGKYIAKASGKNSYPRIIDESLEEYSTGGGPSLSRAGSGIVFTFPGQGSYDPQTLRELHHAFPETKSYFETADVITRDKLGQDFMPVVLIEEREDHDRLLSANPDVPQVAIYLAGSLVAKVLIERGLNPELLVGHSFGELAALATGGVFSIETGVELVCDRVLALRRHEIGGGMAALPCSVDRARQILAKLGEHSIEVAISNHPAQTVVSGVSEDLERLTEAGPPNGLSITRLVSPHPFHSSHLAAAVEPFRRALSKHAYEAPHIPVYSPAAGALWPARADVAEKLSRQLITPFDFSAAVTALREAGYSTFVECGARPIVSRLVSKNQSDGFAATIVSAVSADGDLRAGVRQALNKLGVDRQKAPQEPPRAESESGSTTGRSSGIGQPRAPARVPVAVVAMDCVLPGASDAASFWRNIDAGTSGIVDLGEVDENARRDFQAGSVDDTLSIIPDKSYSLLHGRILEIPYDESSLGHVLSEEEFDSWTRGQRLLALALGRCLKRHALVERSSGDRVHCVLGATADGSAELDEAFFVESMLAELATLDEPESRRSAFAFALKQATGVRAGQAQRLSQHQAYQKVVRRLLPEDVTIYVADSACSSSLYAINLGIKALRSEQADLALAGGVFAPGPANNALFAQFRGLSPSGSRPFDKSADGVVFGDGVAILALKRLPDALAAGDEILGVIRGMGLSSDGKSASINVPRLEGQELALRRALESSAVAAETIQVIEAHATATPVGDRVEIEALKQVFGDRRPDASPIELGSVKALIGHTGWVSGAASVIKLLKAIEQRRIPKQSNFEASNPEVGLDASPFVVARRARDWPTNVDDLPRRAGVSAFGFGGTNAHLILEAFDEGYHRRLSTVAVADGVRQRLAVVGIGSLFPEAGKVSGPLPSGERRFERNGFPLPRKRLLLPDVTDHMDASQFLVALAAEKVLDGLSWDWSAHREEIGVVLGLESKTELGINANKRIFLDQLARQLGEARPSGDLSRDEVNRLLGKLTDQVRRRQCASGPYTLPGLMPNVTASRVCSLFDLKGPNLIVDRGSDSLFQALWVAEQLLEEGDCSLVLAGGVNLLPDWEPAPAEAILLLGLTTESFACERDLPILSLLSCSELTATGEGLATVPPRPRNRAYRGATGAVELASLLAEPGQLDAPCRLTGGDGPASGVTLLPLETGRQPTSTDRERPAASAVYDFVQGTPIERFTPQLVAVPRTASATSLAGHKLLLLTDQPTHWTAVRSREALADLIHCAVLPTLQPPDGDLGIDLASEERLAESIHCLDGLEYDTILAVKWMDGLSPASLVERDLAEERGLLDLLFAVCRHDYDRIGEGRVPVIGLSLSARQDSLLQPSTALLAGFLKSLARELPAARIVSVATDEADLKAGLRQAEMELDQPPQVGESWYLNGRPHAVRLRRLERLARDDQGSLDKDSVVLASGGARGVTAVLAEELLRRHGCTVIALGRTDPWAAPADIREMDEASLLAYETEFYRTELAHDRSQKIPDLKRRFATYRAANEVANLMRKGENLPGRLEYARGDLMDGEAIDRIVADIYQRYGRIDLVMHGAGVQRSKILKKKSLSEFRRIVATKLGGLGNIYRAVEGRRGGRPVHYHLLTSAFSYLGNDGQPDYGAANEAMNRLAASLDDPGSGVRWTSLAWLGWAGIGMTAGSEFAALAASRRLRGVTGEEGAELFSELMGGAPAAPVNVLLAEGEIQFYGVSLEDPTAGRAVTTVRAGADANGGSGNGGWTVFPREVSLDNAPFLLDHKVNGTPTMPAAFLTCLVSEAAQQLWPQLKIVAFEHTRYRRFVRVPPGRSVTLRVRARCVEQDTERASVRVEVLSDFVHKSGRVLQTDIVHCETVVQMARHLPIPPSRLFEATAVDGEAFCDPYVLPGSAVQLAGPFASTHEIQVGPARRTADFLLANMTYPDSLFGYLLPNLMMVDAFWRFGTVQRLGNGRLGVYVPERCRVMRVNYDFVAFDAALLRGAMNFLGTTPRIDGELLHVGPIQVSDPEGNVLLQVEGGVCRKFGEVPWGEVPSDEQVNWRSLGGASNSPEPSSRFL